MLLYSSCQMMNNEMQAREEKRMAAKLCDDAKREDLAQPAAASMQYERLLRKNFPQAAPQNGRCVLLIASLWPFLRPYCIYRAKYYAARVSLSRVLLILTINESVRIYTFDQILEYSIRRVP